MSFGGKIRWYRKMWKENERPMKDNGNVKFTGKMSTKRKKGVNLRDEKGSRQIFFRIPQKY
jgi:hypothetical protein